MNDKDTIDTWFNEYADDIYTYLAYFLGTKDVGDLVQETFIKALMNLDQFRGQASPKTWLLKIARNVAIDTQRKEQRIHWLPESVLTFVAGTNQQPNERVELKETIEDFLYVLKGLKSAYRDVIVARVIQELSIEETSKLLGWSESKVKSTAHRALKSLRLALHEKNMGGIQCGETQ